MLFMPMVNPANMVDNAVAVSNPSSAKPAQVPVVKDSSSGFDGYGYANYLAALQQAAAREQMQFQQASAREAMQFSADQAALNRDFQREMSNTAYQRAVADLRKAGLNPVLAVGASASTPQGNAAQGVAQAGAYAQYSNENIAQSWMEAKLSSSTKVKTAAMQMIGQIVAAGVHAAGDISAAGVPRAVLR